MPAYFAFVIATSAILDGCIGLMLDMPTVQDAHAANHESYPVDVTMFDATTCSSVIKCHQAMIER